MPDQGLPLIDKTAHETNTWLREIADVAIYLIRLADVLGVDLAHAATAKIERNESRFLPTSDDLQPSSD